MYTTIIASALYTLNPIVIVPGSFVIAIHYTIVLTEEEYMEKVFDQEYVDYCNSVKTVYLMCCFFSATV